MFTKAEDPVRAAPAEGELTMLDEVGIVKVRDLNTPKQSLGVGRDDGSFYVYDRPFGASSLDWHMHCGPYATFDDAADWIRAIQEGRTGSRFTKCSQCGGSGSLPDMTCCATCGGGGVELLRRSGQRAS